MVSSLPQISDLEIQEQQAMADAPSRTVENPASDALPMEENPPPTSFVPSLGAWAKRIKIIPETILEENSTPPVAPPSRLSQSDRLIPPPALTEDGKLRFPWAAKMDPKLRNLHRATSPSYLEDGTPMIDIPNHVLLLGLENQKEYVIGQFSRCKTPPGGLIHAVANRIWGKKGKIFTRKIGESSYLFHIPDASTRAWILQRGFWHVDDCLMFVAPWIPEATLAMPEITSIPLWVTLQNIPNRLYSPVGISWVASGLGEPVLTEKPRLDPSLMGKAKILVEMELEKGFPPVIGVRDKKGIVSLVDVEYAWIPNKCDRCGQLGHKESRCFLQNPMEVTKSQEEATMATAALDVATEETVVATDSHVTLATSTVNSTVLAQAIDTSLNAIIAPSAITSTSVSPSVEAEPTTPTIVSTPSSEIVPITTTSASDHLVTGSSPSQSDSLDYEVAHGNVLGDMGDYSRFEIGDFSLTTRGGRVIKPTQKVQEMEWKYVGKRGKRGRGGRGGHGPPSY